MKHIREILFFIHFSRLIVKILYLTSDSVKNTIYRKSNWSAADIGKHFPQISKTRILHLEVIRRITPRSSQQQKARYAEYRDEPWIPIMIATSRSRVVATTLITHDKTFESSYLKKIVYTLLFCLSGFERSVFFSREFVRVNKCFWLPKAPVSFVPKDVCMIH